MRNETAYDSNITIRSPFPMADYPALFVWTERSWESLADDTIPRDIDAWMDWQLERVHDSHLLTWGVYMDGELSGYLEMNVSRSRDHSVEELQSTTTARMVFRRNMWGLKHTRPALNLCLQSFFAEHNASVFLPVLSRTRFLQKLFAAVGASRVGAIGPLAQDEQPVSAELWMLTPTEWKASNEDFLAIAQPREEFAEV